jgi:hypothetical protein
MASEEEVTTVGDSWPERTESSRLPADRCIREFVAFVGNEPTVARFLP